MSQIRLYRSMSLTPRGTSPSAVRDRAVLLVGGSYQGTHSFSSSSSSLSAQPPIFKVGSTTLQQLEEYKAQQKERRTQLHQAKVHRINSILPNRRNLEKKHFLRNQFRAYFQKIAAQHAFWDREANRLQQAWNIHVGVLIERLPIVTPSVPDWEEDFITLSDYLEGKTRKIYPKELGIADPSEYTPPTMEELYASLPEGFTPAPRITPADESGYVQTMDRKLDERIYLAIRNPKIGTSSSKIDDSMKKKGWMLPTTQVQTSTQQQRQHPETLLDAAKRIVPLTVGKDLQVRFISPCPVAVQMFPYDKTKDNNTSTLYYGDKIFYLKGSYEGGTVREDLLQSKNEDWAWLTRTEMVQCVTQDQNEQESLFYHYLL